MQFKKDTYRVFGDVEYTVEGEWLHDVPHGVCLVENENTKGIMTFTYGMMHGGPMWLEYKGVFIESYEYVDDGKCKGTQRRYFGSN